jgi:D-alanine-D-alanine ligase
LAARRLARPPQTGTHLDEAPVRRLRVGILYGGRSSEHEISLASAASIFAHLDRTRYEPIPIRIERDGRWILADRPPRVADTAEVIEQARSEAARAPRPGREVHLVAHPGEATILALDRADGEPEAEGGPVAVTRLGLDVVFPVLHGPYGEDGTVQGLLELADVPYVGAGVLASAVGMDKAVQKVLFAGRGLPVVAHVVVKRRDYLADPAGTVDRVADRLAFPVFVKPANLGSSIGISKAKDRSELTAALAKAAAFDRKLLVEAAVPEAREIECAVLGNDEPTVSVPGEIIPSREFYDYEAKYLDPGSTLLVPAPLGDAETAEIRRLALEAFVAIDAAGMARVDFLMARRTGEVFVNEINTIPGFTTISMYPKLWEASGLPYPALLDRLIELALERHAEKAARPRASG